MFYTCYIFVVCSNGFTDPTYCRYADGIPALVYRLKQCFAHECLLIHKCNHTSMCVDLALKCNYIPIGKTYLY